MAARNIDGGFSPGPAARCDLADGRIVFVKAAGTVLNRVSPVMHRREAEVLAALPDEFPAPKLICTSSFSAASRIRVQASLTS